MKGKKKAALSVLIIILCVGAIICSGCVSKSSDKENKGTTENNQDVQKVSFEAQYVRSGADNEEYPVVTIVQSLDELNAYYENYRLTEELVWREKSTIDFQGARDKYDEEFFKSKKLILVYLQEGSGSIRHEVTSICQRNIEDEEKYVIDIRRQLPGEGTDDMAYWHIFVELEKGIEIEDASQIELEIGEVEMAGYEE